MTKNAQRQRKWERWSRVMKRNSVQSLMFFFVVCSILVWNNFVGNLLRVVTDCVCWMMNCRCFASISKFCTQKRNKEQKMESSEEKKKNAHIRIKDIHCWLHFFPFFSFLLFRLCLCLQRNDCSVQFRRKHLKCSRGMKIWIRSIVYGMFHVDTLQTSTDREFIVFVVNAGLVCKAPIASIHVYMWICLSDVWLFTFIRHVAMFFWLHRIYSFLPLHPIYAVFSYFSSTSFESTEWRTIPG